MLRRWRQQRVDVRRDRRVCVAPRLRASRNLQTLQPYAVWRQPIPCPGRSAAEKTLALPYGIAGAVPGDIATAALHIKVAGNRAHGAGRLVTSAKPRSTSMAWVSCSSLGEPISPVATEGASVFGEFTGAFAGTCAGGSLPGPIGSVFLSAPRRSASRRLSPCPNFSSLSAITTRSGLRPLP